MTKRRKLTALWCWLPVVAVVAALFAQPTSNGQAALGSLTVTPGGGHYGGTNARWEATGLPANARAHLQRRGNTTGAWADVEGSFNIGTTTARGTLTFDFPTPAMNSVYFRVVAGRGATEAHHFTSKHQEADVSLLEQDPLPSDVPLPRGIAVIGEPYRFAVDTVNGPGGETKPLLPGRALTLQRRGDDNVWKLVASGNVQHDGGFRFGPFDGAAQEPGYFRVLMHRWTQRGDDIGWFTSVPYHLDLVHRPEPLVRLAAAPQHDQVVLTWSAPVDPLRDQIVIARTGASQSPTAVKHVIATLGPGAERYVDTAVFQNSTYRYAVYSVSLLPEGKVYTALEERIETSTPSEAGRSGS